LFGFKASRLRKDRKEIENFTPEPPKPGEAGELVIPSLSELLSLLPSTFIIVPEHPSLVRDLYIKGLENLFKIFGHGKEKENEASTASNKKHILLQHLIISDDPYHARTLTVNATTGGGTEESKENRKFIKMIVYYYYYL
jgi:hypothetical protein